MTHAPTVSIFSTPLRSRTSGSGIELISRCVEAAREMVMDPTQRYTLASVSGSAVIDGAVMGREPARNRKKPQAHSRLATLLPRLMSYSATQMTNAVETKPKFVTVGDNPARAFGMDAAERARALAIKAGVEPATAAHPGRST